MKNITLISALALVAVLIFLFSRRSQPEDQIETAAEEPATDKEDSYYTTRPHSEDGIGKFYQGREIAKAMNHSTIDWLEHPGRDSQEDPNTVIDLIDINPADVIADIGAGSGYYTFRLAKKHPRARVVAIDIQEETLGFLEQRIAQLNSQNIITHLGKTDHIDLPPTSIDAALIVDAYHEFSHPYEIMTSLVASLRPEGRIFLVEPRAEDPNSEIKPLHKMTQAQIKREMAFVGLEWIQTHDDLPQQHFMVFRKP